MKKSLLLIGAAALLSLSAAYVPGDPEATEDLYINLVGDADEAIAKGRWEDAERALTDAMKLQPANPGNIMLMSNLGIVQYNRGNDSLALATLTRAHEMAPRSVTVLRNLAMVRTSAGDLDGALRDYETIAGLDSTDTGSRFYHAIISLRRGEMARAVGDIRWLETHAPEDRETLLAQATMASAIGAYEEAVKAYTRLIKKDPQPEYYGERALANIMTDRLGDAADDIASGLALDPQDATLYLYRAMLNKARYRPDDARADAEKAIELGADREAAMSVIR